MSTPPLRIIDPHGVPVVGTDAHLPAVDAVRLTPGALRQRFDRMSAWQAEIAGDTELHSGLLTPASVLVPLVQRREGLNVLLTRRTEHLRDHAGQISFPGGRAEQHDRDAADTALREAEEEIGLPRSAVDIIGELPHYTTITRFRVTPVVALVRPPFTLHPDSFEVAEAFEVPLDLLLDPAMLEEIELHFGGRPRHVLQYRYERQRIWGVTASILFNLRERLASATPGRD